MLYRDLKKIPFMLKWNSVPFNQYPLILIPKPQTLIMTILLSPSVRSILRSYTFVWDRIVFVFLYMGNFTSVLSSYSCYYKCHYFHFDDWINMPLYLLFWITLYTKSLLSIQFESISWLLSQLYNNQKRD